MPCQEPHPETGATCRAEGRHPMHIAGFGSAMVSWANEVEQPLLDTLAMAPTKRTPAKTAQGSVRSLAREVPREERVGPPSQELARSAAIRGMIASSLTAGDQWRSEALAFIREYALTHRFVFCDDLWEAGLPPSESDRALGSVLLALSRFGVIRNSGERRESVRSNNSSAKVVWQSLVYEEQHAADPAP